MGALAAGQVVPVSRIGEPGRHRGGRIETVGGVHMGADVQLAMIQPGSSHHSYTRGMAAEPRNGWPQTVSYRWRRPDRVYSSLVVSPGRIMAGIGPEQKDVPRAEYEASRRPGKAINKANYRREAGH